jgi:alpha-N-arabinofuranosidase
MAIPEFLLRKLYVQGSLKTSEDGFSFALRNTFAPATVTRFQLTVDGHPVPDEKLMIQAGDSRPCSAAVISTEVPLAFSVGLLYTLQVMGVSLGMGKLRIKVITVEAGAFEFSFQAREQPVLRGRETPDSKPGARRSRETSHNWLEGGLRRLFLFAARPLKAEVQVDAREVIGEIHPYVYGHFVEHLERCVYGGIWTEDGSRLREDTLELVKALRPPLIRYPGGNFASGYHWEDGIGPRQARPRRFDKAWNAWESNQVGSDEFLDYCAQVGADPFLVVNDGSGTPEEAAAWVAYCNQPAGEIEGRRRASNGHPVPYGVRLWGVGNEVWGAWQIGHASPAEYATRLRTFAQAMRQADPTLRIVAVGDKVMSDDPGDPGRLWNETVLRQAGDLIDDLSFHFYQPDREGWLESYDMEPLHHTVCAAPLDAEAIIGRMAAQIASLAPGRKIGVAFDEWNLWLAPPENAKSMHQVVYTLRDALYTAGMFHAFHRQCDILPMANLAQLVNVLPAIVTDERRAYATAIYYPFWMYLQMEPVALRVQADVATFDSQTLGNIAAHYGVPYLDVTATRSTDGKRLVMGIINRHPRCKVKASISLAGFPNLSSKSAWQLSGPDPLAANSFGAPEAIKARAIDLPEIKGNYYKEELPACSVTVQVFEVS